MNIYLSTFTALGYERLLSLEGLYLLWFKQRNEIFLCLNFFCLINSINGIIIEHGINSVLILIIINHTSTRTLSDIQEGIYDERCNGAHFESD